MLMVEFMRVIESSRENIERNLERNFIFQILKKSGLL